MRAATGLAASAAASASFFQPGGPGEQRGARRRARRRAAHRTRARGDRCSSAGSRCRRRGGSARAAGSGARTRARVASSSTGAKRASTPCGTVDDAFRRQREPVEDLAPGELRAGDDRVGTRHAPRQDEPPVRRRRCATPPPASATGSDRAASARTAAAPATMPAKIGVCTDVEPGAPQERTASTSDPASNTFSRKRGSVATACVSAPARHEPRPVGALGERHHAMRARERAPARAGDELA